MGVGKLLRWNVQTLQRDENQPMLLAEGKAKDNKMYVMKYLKETGRKD